jgi:hypothetical protein
MVDMGATRAVHRLNTPAALALVLALAGSTAPGGGASAPDPVVIAPAVSSQPTASVTDVEAGATLPADDGSFEPAVRIAATASPSGKAVRADIAEVLLAAYRGAVAASPASCHLPVSLLAAIGQVESGSLAGRPIDAEHRTSVLGPVLDGNGFAAIPDSDRGRWDGDTTWDRAVGPMQFIPATWRSFGADGDGDGVAHPQDVEDAAAGAAAYLCYGSRDLSRPADVRNAVLSYNHSEAYLRLVMTYQQRYARLGLDDGATVAGLPTSISLIATPAADPGRWRAAEVVARENAAARRERARAAAVAPPRSTRAPAKHGTDAGPPQQQPGGGGSGTAEEPATENGGSSGDGSGNGAVDGANGGGNGGATGGDGNQQQENPPGDGTGAGEPGSTPGDDPAEPQCPTVGTEPGAAESTDQAPVESSDGTVSQEAEECDPCAPADGTTTEEGDPTPPPDGTTPPPCLPATQAESPTS